MDLGEYENSENKLSLNEWKEVAESVAAFATAKGGVVRIGIDPGTLEKKGVQIGQTTLEQLANNIKANTNPPQFPSIQVESVGTGDRAVIEVHVEESPIKPVWAFGRPCKRVGRTNQKLSPEETRRLMEVTTGRTWDALPRSGFRASDVDRSLMRSFLRRAGQEPDGTTENTLSSLALLTDDLPCNAATLLFASYPQKFFPEAMVKCGRFLGTTSVDFLDQQTIEGDVLTQLDTALAFIARNTQQAIRITGKAERDVIAEYPPEAVREALINAICHRDYATGGTIQVRIYDDRMEVWNPGELSSRLTLEDLYKGHASHPHNPNLAKAFYRARIIEHWGTGTLRIIKACEERDMPKPAFTLAMGMFIVRFEKPPASVTFPDGADVSERQRQAVQHVQRNNGRITTAEYQILFRLSERQARRDIKKLVDQKILESVGNGYDTFYRLPVGVR